MVLAVLATRATDGVGEAEETDAGDEVEVEVEVDVVASPLRVLTNVLSLEMSILAALASIVLMRVCRIF